MSSNKTRLLNAGFTGNPETLNMVMEFDIYQEAVDYAKYGAYVVGQQFGRSDEYFYVLSETNQSLRFISLSTSPFYSVSEVTNFPLP